MKIALVGRYGQGDILYGPERVARELYIKLKLAQHQIIFIEYFFSDYERSSFVKKIFGKELLNDGKVIRLGLIPLLILLLQEKFDVIHIINHQRFALFILFLKQFLKSKIFFNCHGLIKSEIPRDNYIAKGYFLDIWVEKLSLKKSDLLIFPSSLVQQLFTNNYSIDLRKSVIIPNGVSSIFFQEKASFAPIYDKLNLVFYNGSESFINRGLNELLFLLEKVEAGIKLFVIGSRLETPETKNIETEFIEPMDHNDILSFLKDKHFLIKGPTHDSFSIFIAEGMACGVIPIVNEKIGIKVFIQHEVNGFIYNSESPDGLSNLFNRIAEGKYDLQEISANAKKIYDVLNWERIASRYLEVYQSFL